MLKLVNFILYFGVVLTVVKSEVSNQDSYLNALQNSHQANGASERVADVSFHASPGYEYPPVSPEYGAPPAPVYGPPPPIYGPPKQIYGPPPPHHPIFINHPPAFFHHHHPHEETCDDMMAEDDASSVEARDFGTDKEKLNERINEVTRFATTAMETFSRKYDGCKRDQIWCRFQRTIDVIDKKYPYEKIVQLYLPKADVKV